jgi:hypothetical protein
LVVRWIRTDYQFRQAGHLAVHLGHEDQDLRPGR